MVFRVPKFLSLIIFVFFGFSLPASSQPLIGMSFPPVKNQAEIDFTFFSNPTYQASRLATYLKAISQLPVEHAYYFKLTDGNAYHGLSGLFNERGNPKPALDVFSDVFRNR